jgi:hypothetical protein
MKALTIGLLSASLALVGCARESPKGGPGTKGTSVTTTTTTDGKTTISQKEIE